METIISAKCLQKTRVSIRNHHLTVTIVDDPNCQTRENMGSFVTFARYWRALQVGFVFLLVASASVCFVTHTPFLSSFCCLAVSSMAEEEKKETLDPRLIWIGNRVMTSCKVKADKWRKIATADEFRYATALVQNIVL